MTITQSTFALDLTDTAAHLTFDPAPRFLSEHDIYVAPCNGPQGVHCMLDYDYAGCARCMGWGCDTCTYVTCTTHE